VQRACEEECGEQTEGHVDVEHPAPRERSDDDTAEERAGESGDGPDGAEDALHPRALFDLEDVAHDRQRHRLHAARPDSLNGAEQDELLHRARLAARHRAEEEQRDADEHHRLAPVDVGELAVDGDGHRRRQHVRGEDPCVVEGTTEVCDDRRHRRRDDRHFHRRHEEREQERDYGDGPIRLSHRAFVC
jgi:hypothetical protein